MRFLVTGIGGFAGPHLASVLLEAGHSVYGLCRRRRVGSELKALQRQYPSTFAPESFFVADVLDPRAVRTTIADIKPDGIFHLAGLTFVPEAEADPLAAYRTNFFGTLNVLRGVREEHPSCRVLYVGSGDAYGAAGNKVSLITEQVPLEPVSPYGVSKAAGDLAAFQWHWGGGDVVRARPFNHTGPGQRPQFVCSDFAKQIAQIEKTGAGGVLEVGNLDAVRDFSDVADIVEGYLALWEKGAGGRAYNLCSGRGTSIREIVDTLRARASVPVDVRVGERRTRPNEVRAMVGSSALAQAEVGWRPSRSIEHALGRLLDYWRRELDTTDPRIP